MIGKATVIRTVVLLGAVGALEIAYAYDNFDNPRMYALILFVLAIVTTFNMLVWTWERRLARRRGMA